MAAHLGQCKVLMLVHQAAFRDRVSIPKVWWSVRWSITKCCFMRWCVKHGEEQHAVGPKPTTILLLSVLFIFYLEAFSDFEQSLVSWRRGTFPYVFKLSVANLNSQGVQPHTNHIKSSLKHTNSSWNIYLHAALYGLVQQDTKWSLMRSYMFI